MRVRKDQKKLTGAERTTFKGALQEMFRNGTYQELLKIHHDPGGPARRNHNGLGDPGLYRFLPWHRCFLRDFEDRFEDAQKAIGVREDGLISVPYWRFTDPFPAWLNYTSPYDTVDSAPARTMIDPALKPAPADVLNIIENSYQLLPWDSRFVCFTFALEGLANPINDYPAIRGHAHIHAWVGGVMALVPQSPADPVFWLLHAEVDRLWHVWQQKWPGEAPPFANGDEVMDPWEPTTFDDVASIAALGYDYDDLSYP